MGAKRRILVTSALPNANGAIHLGHLFEHIQTDIWVRFQRMSGNECYYVCADDAHGTATMLAAERLGTTPEAMIEPLREEHADDFRRFLVEHDNYHSTHSPENEQYTREIYGRLAADGRTFTADVEQLYDPERKLFLADRFVKGNCPRCGRDDQYGDNCQECGATYDATELGNPRSLLSDAQPELRSSDHYFFDLAQFTDFLKDWTATDAVQPEVTNKLAEWLTGGLRAWDISRDGPYFGFTIPDTTEKYFYVWMDAPVGYMASFKNLCDRTRGLEFEDFWRADSEGEVHHFIGKDIINFHCLFWPAVLHGAGYGTPTKVHTHGFITVDGVQMSKSRGTFINAGTYLEHLDPEFLRYYFATKLSANTDDVDIQLDDFVQRVNSDLVGKVVNIASRCAGFIHRAFDGGLATSVHDEELWAEVSSARRELAGLYERGDVGRAVRQITALADRTNQYIAEHEPWKHVNDPLRRDEVQGVCSLGINVFRVLVIYLKPILPAMAAKAEAFLKVGPLAWEDAGEPLVAHEIERFKPLFTRIDRKDVDKVVAATVAEAETEAAQDQGSAEVSIDDFGKIDLRIAKVVDANFVDGADKLLELRLELGDNQRTVFAGVREAYDPGKLLGRLVVVVANLAPRKMRFGTSQGMVLAAGPGGEDIFLVSPDAGAEPGMRVT